MSKRTPKIGDWVIVLEPSDQYVLGLVVQVQNTDCVPCAQRSKVVRAIWIAPVTLQFSPPRTKCTVRLNRYTDTVSERQVQRIVGCCSIESAIEVLQEMPEEWQAKFKVENVRHWIG